MLDCLNLLIVHLDALRGDDVPEDLDFATVELVFLQLEVQMVLPQLPKDLLHVVVMFGQVPGVDEDVIYVDDNELPKHLIHETLEDGR